MKYILTLMLAACSLAGAGAQSIFAPVTLAELPARLTFAGERVPLENFDTRESLEREMLVTLYMHSRTYMCLLNTRRYFPVIEPILKKYGIPDDFKYLCMAESGLDPDAVSVARAGGLWQIMPATGTAYGLEVGAAVDERFDVEKATEVACRHLLKSYERFGSWTLAAAAYNLGDAGVATRIERQGTDDYYDSFFPEETLRYVSRILSFKILTQNPVQWGYIIKESQYYKPLTDHTEIAVSARDIDWSKLARENGTTYKMLRELNPWIRDYTFANRSGKTYKVRIPAPGLRTRLN